MSFRYCLNTSTIMKVPTILEKIEIAAKAGYNAIELWNDDITEHVESGGSLEDIRKALDDAGLERPDLIHFPRWMEASEEDWPAKLEEAKMKMAQGAAIDAGRIVAGPAWTDPIDFDLAAERYTAIMELGGSMGCLPALEYLSITPAMKTLSVLLEVVKRADHPQTKFVLDAFHIWNGGGAVSDIEMVSPDQIQIFHINDAPQGGQPLTLADPDRVMPGDGIIPLGEMLATLKKQGWSGCLSLELFREDLWARDPLEVAKEGLEKVREVVERTSKL